MNIPEPVGGDVNIGGPMMRTIWTLYGITIVIVGLRLYAQMSINRRLGLGDIMMTLSVVCGVFLCATLTVQHHYGLGRHFFYLDTHQKIMAIKFNFIGQAFGVMAPSFGRMACCMLMLQLFGNTRHRRWGIWVLFWESFIVNILVVILIYVQCKDIQSLWDPVGHPSKCWSPNIQTYTGFVQGGLNSAVDLVLTILPATIFWNLQIDNKLKAGLAVLLGLSIFALVACVIKTVELKTLGDRGDFTLKVNTVPFFTWVVVESTLVSIAASVPLIRPLIMKHSKKGSIIKNNNTYEMKKRYGSSGSKITRLQNRGSKDGELDIESSSAQNILPAIEDVVDVERGSESKIMIATTCDVQYDYLETPKGTSAVMDTVVSADRVKAPVRTDDRLSQNFTPWRPMSRLKPGKESN